MNWGTKIAIFYTFFAVSMVCAVIYASMQSFHLVSPEYYAEEIAYENRIQEKANVNKLEGKISIQTHKSGQVAIHLPEDLEIAEGTLRFYRPSDAKLDQLFPMALNQNPQIIPVHDWQKGNWNLQLRWSDGTQTYFFEQKISIDPS